MDLASLNSSKEPRKRKRASKKKKKWKICLFDHGDFLDDIYPHKGKIRFRWRELREWLEIFLFSTGLSEWWWSVSLEIGTQGLVLSLSISVSLFSCWSWWEAAYRRGIGRSVNFHPMGSINSKLQRAKSTDFPSQGDPFHFGRKLSGLAQQRGGGGWRRKKQKLGLWNFHCAWWGCVGEKKIDRLRLSSTVNLSSALCLFSLSLSLSDERHPLPLLVLPSSSAPPLFAPSPRSIHPPGNTTTHSH